MSEALPSVSVIIRTKAASERCGLLPRAVESVLAQERVAARCLIVVNNDAYDRALVDSLKLDERVACIILPYPDKSRATLMGRENVRTEFFSFLDDDDELLPDALAMRTQFLREHPEIDCVATNGDYIHPLGTRPVFRDCETSRRTLPECSSEAATGSPRAAERSAVKPSPRAISRFSAPLRMDRHRIPHRIIIKSRVHRRADVPRLQHSRVPVEDLDIR